MDLYEGKQIKPMLIGATGEAFDSPDYLYELKFDGERCIAYLDPKEGTQLRNKRNVKMLPKFPELSALHKQVRKRCILDGELMVMKNGRPDFSAVQRRSLLSNPFRIQLAAKETPAAFTAFDILYLDGEDVTKRPLTERKKLLHKTVKEGGALALSRVFEQGVALFSLARQNQLEGIVAKRKDSLYFQDKRTKDWIKCKNLLDEDFVVLGWIPKENHMTSIVLGQYKDEELVYKGHVTLKVNGPDFAKVRALPKALPPFAPVPKGNENANWVQPVFACKVAYMEKTAGGGMRQPVFKGLREDKAPEDCIDAG